MTTTFPRLMVFGEALTDFIRDDAQHWRSVAGGSCWNVARVGARLGVPTAFAGTVSRDIFGDELVRKSPMPDSTCASSGRSSARRCSRWSCRSSRPPISSSARTAPISRSIRPTCPTARWMRPCWSRAARPALLHRDTVLFQPAFVTEVADTVGCGDASIDGWLASQLACPDATAADHLRYAAACAAVACAHAGAYAPTATVMADVVANRAAAEPADAALSR